MKRISFIGNTFHCVVVAFLLGSWAVGTGYLAEVPTVDLLWQRALGESLGGHEFNADQLSSLKNWTENQIGSRVTAADLKFDPAVHTLDLGDPDHQNWQSEMISAMGPDWTREGSGDTIEYAIRE